MTNRTRHHLRTLTRRLALYLLLPFSLLLATRLLWGLESAHRLATVKSQLLAKGINLEIPHKRLPPEEDAFNIISDAAKSSRLSDEDKKNLHDDGTQVLYQYIWTEEELPRVKQILVQMEPAFQKVDAVETLDRRTSPSAEIGKELAPLRSFVEMLALDAAIAHRSKDDFRALADIHRMLVVSRVTMKQGMLIDYLVGIFLHNLAAQTIEHLEADLDLRPPATREAAVNLAREFADTTQLKSDLLSTFHFEIACTDTLIRPYYAFNDWWISPLRDDVVARAMNSCARQLDGLAQDGWPAAQARFIPVATQSDTNLDLATHWDINDSAYAPRASLLYFRSVATARAAATLLASRAYAATHGAPTPTPSELAPTLLPTLPLDPFSDPLLPFHFRNDAAGLTLWSIGEDAIDDGGMVLFDAAGDKRSRYGTGTPAHQSDMIFGAAWRNATPPPAAALPLAPPE